MKLLSSASVRRCALYASAFSLFSLSSRAQSSNPRPITIDDVLRIQSVHDPQLSPDAHWVAYAVDKTLLKEDKTETRLWMIPFSGGDAIPLTAEGVSSSHPRWSPDAKFLAFLSARNGRKTQVWLLNRLGGEATRLTDTVQDVKDFAWSPDGRRLVLVLRDPSPEELEAAKSKAQSNARSDESSDAGAKDQSQETKRPWVIDRLQFKQDEIGYLDRRRNHLYVFNLSSKSLTQITSGDFDDSEPAWSPDAKFIAFTCNRDAGDPDRTYDSDIWVVPANVNNPNNGVHLTQVTSNAGSDSSPTWSPDGKWIAYVTQLDPKLFDYATVHLAVSPSSGGPAKVLTQSLDRNISSPRFSSDGKTIYFIVDDNGTQNLAAFVLSGQPGALTFGDGQLGARPIPGSLFVSSYSVGAGPTGNVMGGTIGNIWSIAAEVATIDRPSEIYVVTPGGKPVQLTHTNDALFSQLKLSHGEYVHFKSKDGTPVSGYLYKPLDYVPGKKYPTLLRPHGGPVWAYYAEFSDQAQLFAANGYVVLFPNPRGSSGYGEDFCKAIYADWGNKDFQDDMAMVDYAIEQGIADPDKLGVGGWSYGGMSTDFIIAQTTRFKAAISGAGVAEILSMYGHDQYQKDYETELGLPWENLAAWTKVSPFRNVAKITTPTLFMGGNIDWNVPILGSEQMYQALKRLGVPTELVVYPDEYHEFSVPSHLKDRLERYLAWYAHFVKADGTPASPPEPATKSSD